MRTEGYEYETFVEARAMARRRRRRVLLPLAVVAVMLLALIGIAIHNYRAMREDALELSRGVIENLQQRIETEVEAFLRPINGITTLSRDLLANRLAAGIPDAEVEALGISVLANAPQLTALYVGNREGEFLMVRRDRPDGQDGEQPSAPGSEQDNRRENGRVAFETKRISRSERAADGFEIAYTWRDEQGRVVSRESAPWDRYDPRTRPWYLGADRDRRLHWTEVYPFFTDRAPGITASMPVTGSGDALVAAIGVDVALQSISRFMASLSIGKSGQAMIVDGTGRLIAHPRADLIRERDDGELRLTHVEDLDDPVVKRAYDRFRVENVGHRDFELGGRRYISAASSLGHLLGRDWSVLVVVPEDDFVGFVGDNVRDLLAMGLATMALAGLLAWLLIRQGLRTDREAVSVLEHKAELDASARAFGELAASDSISLDPGNPAALRPFTESAAQAARVRRVGVWHLDPASGSLSCVDCYDRDSGAHTHGTQLAPQDHPEFFAALEAEPLLAAVDAGADPRLASIERHYLRATGCRALLAVPIKAGQRAIGAVLLEDTGQRSEWGAHTTAFARALANLLAVGTTSVEPVPNAAPATPGEAVATPTPARAPTPLDAAFRDLDLDTSLGERRAAAFAARLSAHSNAMQGAELIEQLAVLSLRLTDSAVLAEPAGHDGSETTVAHLLDEIQAAARDERIDYLKFFSDQLIASVDPNEDVDEALRRLAEFALRIKAICESLFARRRDALAFRIGIDAGPAIGSLVGREHRAFAFWGEAVRTAMNMADSSFPGSIQVTETVYRRLSGRYVFQTRGRHYLEGVGEFSTYVLGGRS